MGKVIIPDYLKEKYNNYLAPGEKKEADEATIQHEYEKLLAELSEMLFNSPKEWIVILKSIRDELLPEMTEVDGANIPESINRLNTLIEECRKTKPSLNLLKEALNPEIVFIFNQIDLTDLVALSDDDERFNKDTFGLKDDEGFDEFRPIGK